MTGSLLQRATVGGLAGAVVGSVPSTLHAVLTGGQSPRGFGAVAGLAIAGLDLGIVGRRVPAIWSLHQSAQVADHVVYGAVVAAVAVRW